MSHSGNNPPPPTDHPQLRLVGADDEPEVTTSSPAEPSRRFAHELSNLLDGALRNLSLAMSRLDEDEVKHAEDETATRLRTANDGMRQMAQLLHRWMRTGVTDPAQLYWQQSTFEDALNYALKMIEPAIEAAGIHLEVDVADDVLQMPAGPLYPILANALQNAVEAVGHNGWIDLRGRTEADTTTLTVEDNGPGLHPDLPRKPDGSAQLGATTKSTGHGMGLAISQQIAEALQGTISLTDREGGGAILQITWPTNAPKT